MERHYAMRLLREACKHPSRLIARPKFWHVDFFNFYLERVDDLLFRTPQAGLALARHGPALAAKVAAAHPETASGPALLLLAHAHLGSAHRAVCDYAGAEEAFRHARLYQALAPGPVVADFLRRFAYLRLVQHDPAAFPLIEEAISIHKRGNLVDRHELGECLVCRGHAYFAFKQPAKAVEDWTAALNHLSLQRDPKPYYATLHNLASWAVTFGTADEIRMAHANLKPALSLLNALPRRHFAKLKLRWLLALTAERLGHHAQAELALLEVQRGLERLRLPYEVGMVAIDRAALYLRQGQLAKLEPLAAETARIFRRLGVEAKAREALDLWHQAAEHEVDERLLQRLRQTFARLADPMPALAT